MAQGLQSPRPGDHAADINACIGHHTQRLSSLFRVSAGTNIESDCILQVLEEENSVLSSKLAASHACALATKKQADELGAKLTCAEAAANQQESQLAAVCQAQEADAK